MWIGDVIHHLREYAFRVHIENVRHLLRKLSAPQAMKEGPSMKAARKGWGVAAAVGGLVFGVFGGAFAASSLHDAAEPGVNTLQAIDDKGSHPALLRPTTGKEAPAFSAQISALAGPEAVMKRDGVSVQLTRPVQASDAVCYRVEVGRIVGGGCITPEVLKSGLGYMAYKEYGGEVTVVGIVPDEIVSVVIAGLAVPVDDNVWIYSGQSSPDLTFSVTASDSRTVELGSD